MMRTFEAIATVTSDGKLHLEIPVENVEIGEHAVTVVLKEVNSHKSKKPLPRLKFNSYPWYNYPPEFTFRREDMYEDDDR